MRNLNDFSYWETIDKCMKNTNKIEYRRKIHELVHGRDLEEEQ